MRIEARLQAYSRLEHDIYEKERAIGNGRCFLWHTWVVPHTLNV